MTLHMFDLGTMEDLDGGRVAAAFRHAMARAVSDCEDRPAEENARKVTLQAELVPVNDEDGRCESVNVKFQVSDKIPTRKSKTYSFGVKQKGGKAELFFSDEDPGNIKQLGFGDMGGDGSSRREFAEDETEE